MLLASSVTKNKVAVFSNGYFLGIFATGLIFFKCVEEVSFAEEAPEGLRVLNEGSAETSNVF